MALQPFKENDETEAKVKNAALTALENRGDEIDDFFNDAFTAYPLGDVLYILERDPMAGVILEETYRVSFPEIHELFTRPATFEFYLDVLRSVWGDDADITFTIPEPGKLQIGISSLELELQTFLAREIVSDSYVYSEMTETLTGDTLIFQGTQGIKDQREADALINELSARGIFTTINLTIV